MYDFLVASHNIPFAVAVVLLIVLFVIELISAVMGFGLSDMIGGADAPDFVPDADVHLEPGHFGKFFDWLNFGKVPVIILLVVFLTMFALFGYLCQGVLWSVGGFLLPWPLAVVPAVIVALPSTRICGRVLARFLPKDETAAISQENLIGATAVIVLGKAAPGSPAQAKVRDKFGTTHYLMVEPDNPGEEFSAGQEVLLVRNDGHRFFAIAVKLQS